MLDLENDILKRDPWIIDFDRDIKQDIPFEDPTSKDYYLLIVRGLLKKKSPSEIFRRVDNAFRFRNDGLPLFVNHYTSFFYKVVSYQKTLLERVKEFGFDKGYLSRWLKLNSHFQFTNKDLDLIFQQIQLMQR